MKILSSLLLVVSLGSLAGCFVRTGPGYSQRGQESSRSCPPAYHWDGGACVHNGNGEGNGHGKGHGHDH